MRGFSEPCLCGDPGCFRCYGESARYYGWCDECTHFDAGRCDPDKIAPGDKDCLRKQDADDAWADYYLSQQEDDNG